MRVAVTHLKAPWPTGVAIGSVVALACAAVPGWAAGKCVVLAEGDEREAEFAWEPPQIDRSDPQERTFVVNPAAVAEQLQEHASRIGELGQQLLDAELALSTARAENDSLGAQLQDAAQALSTARAEIASLNADLQGVAAERDKARAELAAATAPKAAKKAPAA
jgi:DNA repair exonuclease SbcCD ATPase subunit